MGKRERGEEESENHTWDGEEEDTAAAYAVDEGKREDGEEEVCGGDEHACGGGVGEAKEGEDGGGEVHERILLSALVKGKRSWSGGCRNVQIRKTAAIPATCIQFPTPSAPAYPAINPTTCPTIPLPPPHPLSPS